VNRRCPAAHLGWCIVKWRRGRFKARLNFLRDPRKLSVPCPRPRFCKRQVSSTG
jgi:hypothetical protein